MIEKNQKQNPNKLVRTAATAALAGLAFLGVGMTREANKPSTTSVSEIEATRNLLANPESAEELEGVLVIKSGANIRTTPQRKVNMQGSNDGQATTESVENVLQQVPAGKSLVISRARRAGDGFVAFTLPSNPVEPGDSEVEIAKKTVYVDFAELRSQGLAELKQNEAPIQPDVAAATQPEIVDKELFMPVGEFLSNDEVADRVNTYLMPAD